MPKKRSKTQQLEKESRDKLSLLMNEWIVNPLENDYGFDFDVRFTENTKESIQKVESQSFYIQLKSSFKMEGSQAIVDLSVVDVELFVNENIPVILIKYYEDTDSFFWEIVQTYVWDILNKEDPKWKSKSSKRIYLKNKLDDLSSLKDEILKVQKRINRKSIFNLSLGEGIKYDEEDLSEISKHIERNSSEAIYLGLMAGTIYGKMGDKENCIKTNEDVYSKAKGQDKIYAIFGIVFSLNPTIPMENKEIIKYCLEGIDIANSLNKDYFANSLIIIKNQAEFEIITKNICQVLMSHKAIENLEDMTYFSMGYIQKLREFEIQKQNVLKEMNKAIKGLLKKGSEIYYIGILPTVIDIISSYVGQLAVFDREVLKIESEERKDLLGHWEDILRSFPDKHTKMLLYSSLSHYYYVTLNSKKALDYIKKSISLSEELGDKSSLSSSLDFKKIIENKPSPYTNSSSEASSEMTMEEFKEKSIKMLYVQGYDLLKEDEDTNIIKMALDDLDTTPYLKECENLRIRFLPSTMGKLIVLHSLGHKYIWCKYSSGLLETLVLKRDYNEFKSKNCIKCKYRKPRDKSWKCTVKFFDEQQQDKEFTEVIKKFFEKINIR